MVLGILGEARVHKLTKLVIHYVETRSSNKTPQQGRLTLTARGTVRVRINYLVLVVCRKLAWLKIGIVSALSFNNCVTLYFRSIGFGVGSTAMLADQLQSLFVLGV